MGCHFGPDLRHVIGIAPAVDRQCGNASTGSERSQSLEGGQRATLGIEPADHEKFGNGRAGRLDLAEKNLGRNTGINNSAVADSEPRSLARELHGLAAKIEMLEAKRRERIRLGGS